jgi:histidinol phosphatase-like PHP family hydrolase
MKTLKLDLHTHPVLALKEKLGISGIRDINKEVAAAIVKAVKSAGLNGIAITEHNNFNHGWVSAMEIMDHFQGENLVILPGSEIDFAGQHYLQIYIPDYFRKRIPFFKGKEWFMILAHPGYYQPLDISRTGQVEIDAVEGASLRGEFEPAGNISTEKGIAVVRTSDAHCLEDIGRFYIEVESSK